ncbi:MAG: NfeD family protein [Planctomycetota bacterium]
MDPFYIALILYVAALGLAFVDLFIPSSGMLLLMAGLAAVGCILFGFRSSNAAGMTMLTIILASIPTFAVLAIKIWPMTPIGRRVILPVREQLPKEDVEDEDSGLIGQVLQTDSPLMPGGQIRIEGKSRNAVAKRGFIEAGQNVEIVGIQDFNLVVLATENPPTISRNSPRLHQESEQTDAEGTPTGNLLDLPAEDLGLDSLD